MSEQQLRGYFVTGTDTGVGKTLVSQILLHRFRAVYVNVAGFKPVASGSDMTADGLRNADALALQRAGSVHLPYDAINPYAFAPAVAPHLAAEKEHVTIDCERIARGITSSGADCVVVEGVGGWYVPLNDHQTVADLAKTLALPVVLVVGLRLGCLNHALLTAAAIRESGLMFAGWVANKIDPGFDLCDENVDALCTRLDAPLLLRLPFFQGIPDAEDLARAWAPAPF